MKGNRMIKVKTGSCLSDPWLTDKTQYSLNNLTTSVGREQLSLILMNECVTLEFELVLVRMCLCTPGELPTCPKHLDAELLVSSVQLDMTADLSCGH